MLYACPRCKEAGIDPAKGQRTRCSRCSNFAPCHVCQKCGFTICEVCARDPKKAKFVPGGHSDEMEV